MNSAHKQKKPASGVVNAVVSGQWLVASKTKGIKTPYYWSLLTGNWSLILRLPLTGLSFFHNL